MFSVSRGKSDALLLEKKQKRDHQKLSPGDQGRRQSQSLVGFTSESGHMEMTVGTVSISVSKDISESVYAFLQEL